MSNYGYNPKQKEELLNIIKLLDDGVFPVVKINDSIFEDCYLEKNMFARLISAEWEGSYQRQDEENEDIVYIFKLDFKEFENDNIKKESSVYYDKKNNDVLITASEAGYKPKNCVEDVCHSINHGKIFFELQDDNSLINEFLKSNSPLSYVEWLENIVLSSRK